MDPAAAKLIGAGLATLALAGAGIGIGLIFGNFLAGALRNPAAAARFQVQLYVGFALAEATGLIGFVVGMLILFGF
ncbi:MAG: F0F1 ATP synthase subunit C [Pseudomonadota bacterium]